MKEIELKFLLDARAAEALGSAPALAELASGPAETLRLRTIYHDTAEGTLAAAGIALRLRHDGRAWVQTVKAGRAMQGALSEAREVEVAVPSGAIDLDAIPEADVAERVRGLVNGCALAPVFETEITRTRRPLSLPYLGAVEFALDEGHIRAGNRSEPICEAEFELVSGSPHAVFEAARRLLPRQGVRLSRLNKAERGALLAGTGTIFPAAEPRNALKVDLRPGLTTEQGARTILSECLDQIVANVAAVEESDDPEGPHQLRVGLRRLRSALQLFEGALSGPQARALADEAQWLGHEVGRLRDLDVAIIDIVEPEIAAGPSETTGAAEPGFKRLAEALAGAAATTRRTLRATLSEPRARAFQLALTEFVAARGWLDPSDWDQTGRLARPLAETAAEALEKRLAKTHKRAGHIEGLDIESRHDLRKELKKLRYGVEFFSPLFPEKKVKPFLKRLKALQEIFGDLNDAAMAAELFRDPKGPAGRDLASARAAGYLIGVRSERARASWDHARGHWKALRETEPFWR